MSYIIYDTEICHGIATPDNPPQPGYRYAAGWTDFAGMGIAVIAAYDLQEAQSRVFMADNFEAFAELVDRRDGVIGFNNWQFDDKLLRANGLGIPAGKSIDIAAGIWRAAGIPQGDRPRGLGLDDCCKANRLPGKSGKGADAPQDFQSGRIGRVIDYCLGDVRCTLQLYRHIARCAGLVDPRDGKTWLNVPLIGMP